MQADVLIQGCLYEVDTHHQGDSMQFCNLVKALRGKEKSPYSGLSTLSPESPDFNTMPSLGKHPNQKVCLADITG